MSIRKSRQMHEEAISRIAINIKRHERNIKIYSDVKMMVPLFKTVVALNKDLEHLNWNIKKLSKLK
tara:strand:- start:749 stop:946 length:198 start_codon:yes stop_codon:yes gene_type:complete